MSSLTVEEDQKWVPTHVQVTVLRGRGLRGKGKHGTSDVYTIIQLGKEKYSTCVVEKTTEPEWREECSFELQPGVLEGGGRSGYPAGSNELVLTVMHRALIEVFLGQAVIHLEKLYHESRCVKNEWYRLNSKTGKKEKERGEIQVTVQFTRNNLTASMYDLVMKDKAASTFGKLKERMRGKRRSSDDDSSSAVLPGGYGTLCRMRQRLPSDGGGEEDYEDDEGGEARRSKMRTFFLRGKLRKSSDTRSSTSLGSESSESSSRGGSLSPTAGISVVVSDLSNSPSNSSNLTVDSPEHTGNTSPKSMSSLKCEFGDEPGEISIAVPPPNVYVNGSHAYNVKPRDPGSGKPADSLGLGLLQKSLPLSMSLQNLSPQASTDLPRGPAGDGRRWSFDKPGEEEKAAIVAALEQSGPMLGEEEEEEERLRQEAPPKAAATTSSSSVAESEHQGKKPRRNFFYHGRSESAGKGQSQSKDESEQAPAATEEKHKGWFGSKDSHSKPSPHPVKPLTTAMLAEEKRTEGRSVLATGLEKLKSTIHPGRSSQLSEQEADRKKSLTEGAGSYYHLNHSELVALLVQREAELERQKVEFERQKSLLAKREVELRKLKPQVRDLEDYIDTLLVRIMEQKPTLLQVRSKLK
uniref:RAB11 family interacting protein 5a (class I) n=1 Tax=Dicentrarchus labrax TaxID=13489 RepID=A0A8C4NW55_DICLA